MGTVPGLWVGLGLLLSSGGNLASTFIAFQKASAITVLIPVILLFQNCSPPTFEAVNDPSLGSIASDTPASAPPVTCTLPTGGQLTPGNSVTGYPISSAVSPLTCGSLQTRTCTSSGQFDGSMPLHSSCQQLCQHPFLNGTAVNSGFQLVYFTKAMGTSQADCDAAKRTTSCSQNTGLFSPGLETTRYASCLVQGQTCAYTASNGTSTPTGNSVGATVSGFSVPSATYPQLCGTSVTRTCQSNGSWSGGSVPLYTACAQKCLHPDSNQPVDSGSQFIYYTRSSGTAVQCQDSRVVSSCQSSSGLFSPAPVAAASRFASCQVTEIPALVTLEMLTGNDNRYNVFKANCTSCHNNTTAYGNLNLLSAANAKPKASLILSRMKHENKALAMMPPAGTINDTYKMGLVEKWVSLGAPSEGDSQSPSPVPPTPPAGISLTCDPNNSVSQFPIKRISRLQYTNALMELLANGGLLGWSDRNNEGYRLMGTFGPLINIIPADNAALFSFSTNDSTITSDHYFSYLVISSTVADTLSKTASWLNSNSSGSKTACLSVVATNGVPTEACVRSFIKKFGQKALRKKFSLAEENEFLAVYNSGSTSQDKLAILIQTFLMSPRYLNIVEVDGTPSATNPNLLQLNDYELAQRLSLHFLQGIPTDEMMTSAEQGKFTASESSYQAEVAKILQVERNPASPNLMRSGWDTHPAMLSKLQKTYHNFINEWLEVEKLPEIAPSNMIGAVDALYGYPHRHYGNTNVSGPIRAALMDETYNFALRMMFAEDKKFYDLMTNKSIMSNGATRSFYQLPAVPESNTYAYGHATQQMTYHTGLLTRAITTLKDSVTDDPHPFLRGAFIRREILCDPLGSPSADALPDRALTVGEIVAESKRTTYENKVSTPDCMGCHTQINPLGFALDDFDSMSRFRGNTFEPIFETVVSAAGQISYRHLKNVPVNAATTNLNIDSPTGESVNGGVQFSEMVGNSYKGNMCFARQIFRHTMGRFESSRDACMLNDMYNRMRANDGNIEKMILNMPFSDSFRMKRIGG